ncbi:GGDEF domain-containing protein [Malaciobacter molluscorum LMG 25693]|uniref:Diguanylate cyclase/phosphodiesterase (LapD/MoxY domain) n=1 Tax=Malaciobacter molluscorum LMG 25693 TaxID=870501 RepID=A0A2G1DJ75_9BACT|nr:EAL domain-containing protein [Malaciobacter molluscorum]AXX91642.1 diguanylate cyclase/phosphodiesterase (LapD/MoxY domain) [Malaciobacter molluscorum LMG 25693]PHO18563.1 GGDEF domain-containing protein [Malaciobacter molluscorum LMG 25693]RXJ94607.1 GGDEF domain-containing protein [Malaciobacter molluscorum]
MSLSKQLYIIIAFIFLIIFTGNFIISVQNTKEYLETEASTKAQDTATSLGMSLKGLMKNKNDAEIQSIINAIANRGFYKEIRLENAVFTITKKELIQFEQNRQIDSSWKLSNLSVDKNLGEIESNNDDLELMQELEALESNSSSKMKIKEPKKYKFTPTKKLEQKSIKINFTASKNTKSIDTYAIIKLNKTLAKVTRAEKFDYVPQWFINAISINLKEMKSEISDGWKTTAIIYVSANAGDAYAKLYEQAKNGIIYSLIAFIISMILLFIFVQYLLKPLKNIEKLAQSISIGNFKTIEKLPYTTEMRNVAISMNDMSTKIESVISKLNKNLEKLTQKLSKDELTGLNIKQTFETDMKKMFISKSRGFIFTIKIDNLSAFAKTHTNDEVNQFIKKFAKVLEKCKQDKDINLSAYRFYGSEFALITDGINYEQAKNLTKLIKQNFEELAQEFGKKDIAHIGATPFNPIGTTQEMLLAANEAYEKAKLIGPNEAYIRDNDDLARDMNAWRDLVFDIIGNQKFEIDYIGDAKVLNGTNRGIVVMQEAFTKAFDLEKNPIPIGTFVSIAEKYEKIVDFDKAVISKIIDDIRKQNIKHNISINLSFDSIDNLDFIVWLKETLLKNKDIAQQIVFSLTAYAVTKNITKFKNFVDVVHSLDSKIIVKRFESKFIALDDIKDLDLDYIRLAREYTKNIKNDSSKQSFVEALVELTHLLNIKLFAENVIDEEDLEKVRELKVYAASK